MGVAVPLDVLVLAGVRVEARTQDRRNCRLEPVSRHHAQPHAPHHVDPDVPPERVESRHDPPPSRQPWRRCCPHEEAGASNSRPRGLSPRLSWASAVEGQVLDVAFPNMMVTKAVSRQVHGQGAHGWCPK